MFALYQRLPGILLKRANLFLEIHDYHDYLDYRDYQNSKNPNLALRQASYGQTVLFFQSL